MRNASVSGIISLMLVIGSQIAPVLAMPLSLGDKIKLTIPEGEEFAGGYEVDTDGALELPHIGAFKVVGLEPEAVAEQLSQVLVERGYFQKNFARVNLQVLSWAPVQVEVEGATFFPGRVQINDRSREVERKEVTELPGDAAPERFLTTAIQAAGGVMPDADLKNIRLIRGGVEKTINLDGIIDGGPVEDVPLVAGDRVVVPSTQIFQSRLVRPSQITPPGINVLLSNLSVPASSNASSSAGGSDARNFPYGARLSQAVMAANCVGGTQTTNAGRHGVLVRTDRLSGVTNTLDRPIEDIIRQSNHDNNPLLMSGDGVACYDSAVTNIKDIFSVIAAIINPFSLLFGPARIFGGLR
ncbi:MAG: polysaccharide export protein [Gemmatimonadaceae bacterium]|nr:polysaccharide export protein [Gloeobacterales cyanobacterium ES-bin-141]